MLTGAKYRISIRSTAACSDALTIVPSHPAHGSLQTVCLLAYAPDQSGPDTHFMFGNCCRGGRTSSIRSAARQTSRKTQRQCSVSQMFILCDEARTSWILR